MDNRNDENRGSSLPLGLCLGLAVGTAIGAATDSMSIWMSAGAALGVCFGLLLDRESAGDESEDAAGDEKPGDKKD